MKPAARSVAVVGGGPAGLMAAEVLASAGHPVDVYDAMPSVGRKFLLAGIGGMNITHAEPFADFISRYRSFSDDGAARIRALLDAFTPDDLRGWIHGLGIETFVGTSGRVFPKEMKAAPLLRAWLHRLRDAGVRIHTRHRWQGWVDDALLFGARDGERRVHADAVVLATGGGSWPRLGSDGAWQAWLRDKGVAVNPLLPANCGFEADWSDNFRERFAGAPVKPVRFVFTDASGSRFERKGEFIVTASGIEGGLVYALSAALRDEIIAYGSATLQVDLAPDRSAHALADALSKPRGRKSFAEHLRRQVALHDVKAGLLRELGGVANLDDPTALAARIKALPLRVTSPRPLDEAISTAGGVAFGALDEQLMLRRLPGVFCAGEMLDWEAPTGGYLLSACFATGRAAGEGALRWLAREL